MSDNDILNTYEDVDVKFIKERKAGRGTVYSVALNDGGQADFWLSTGFTEPNFAKGDKISFDTYENANGYEEIDCESIQVTPKKRSQRRNTSSASKAKPKNGTTNHVDKKKQFNAGDKEDYWAFKQKLDLEHYNRQKKILQPRYMFQAAQERAIKFVDLLLRHESIDLKVLNEKGNLVKAKPNQLVQAMEELTQHYTREFYEAAGSITIDTGVSAKNEEAVKSEPEDPGEGDVGPEDGDNVGGYD